MLGTGRRLGTGQESEGMCLGQGSGDGEEGEDGKRLVLHGALRTL